jgi:hypothetical protein
MSVKKYINNSMITTDLGLLLKNMGKIFKLFNIKKLFCGSDDLGFTFVDFKNIFTIDSSVLKKAGCVKRIGNKEASVVYVNGILTTKKEAFKQNAFLSKTLNKDVETFYNETGGLLVDLLESSWGRNVETSSESAKVVASHILDKLKNTNEDEIHFVGYSQGAIILNNALNVVQNILPEEELKRIKFTTFGAALNECKLNKNIRVEHFANVDDPVPNLGILIKDIEHSGEIYTRDGSGHFFINSYLKPLKNGDFGKESNFYKEVNKADVKLATQKMLEKHSKINISEIKNFQKLTTGVKFNK